LVTCSATMTVDNSFEHYKRRVGLFGYENSFQIREAILSSPFDYRRQAILALPNDLPNPNDSSFIDKIVPFVVESIRISNGGVFVLCTSYSMLRKLHQRCNQILGEDFSLFKQGQMGRVQLLSTFIKTPRSVLFGADSFWEGVSVTGENLKMILIPRLPFRVPTEPVQQARHELIEAQGGNPFREYSLPQAALKLRQGFGRLIRTQRDRGSVVVLDHRITKMWYGKFFIHSLPKLKRLNGNSSYILKKLSEFHSQNHPPQPIPHFGQFE
jgi:ATP-dependent DNA helicase DinG